ncbi:MAG TPA: DMT family transporter [Robiginitalea sp.]|nr:DMT family transporter [Robiginitalea sp.]
MWDLIWSIACSTTIFVVFKLYDTYRIHTQYAIIGNYLTAFAVGAFFFNGPEGFSGWTAKSWLLPAAALGVLFVFIFNLMARTSQTLGVSVASVATKMSLVIPVFLGVILYGETLGTVKILGVGLALAAVFFASVRSGGHRLSLRSLLLPTLVFLGSGIIDASLKYLEETRVPGPEFPLFSASVFLSAALSGLLYVWLRRRKSLPGLRPKDLLGAIALGVPNFFSVYFLLRALQYPGLNSASLFTLNNVAIVAVTTLLGVLLFRERLSPRNWLGVGLAVVSIILVGML